MDTTPHFQPELDIDGDFALLELTEGGELVLRSSGSELSGKSLPAGDINLVGFSLEIQKRKPRQRNGTPYKGKGRVRVISKSKVADKDNGKEGQLRLYWRWNYSLTLKPGVLYRFGAKNWRMVSNAQRIRDFVEQPSDAG